MINLNLNNFESKEALHCPYILTSPRSLKSCRVANVKPIELLHRSIQDISADLNIPLQNANQIYEDHENERLRKLEVCKMIRKHMMVAEIRAQEVDEDTTKSMKQYLNEHQQLEKTTTNYSRGNTPEYPASIKESRCYSPALSLSPQRLYAGSPTKKRRNKLHLSRETSSSSGTPSPFQSYEMKKTYSVSRRTKSAESIKRIRTARDVTDMRKSVSSMSLIKKGVYAKNPGARNDRQLCWQVDRMKNSESTPPNPYRAEKKIHFEKRIDVQKHDDESQKAILAKKSSFSKKDVIISSENRGHGVKQNNVKNHRNKLNEKMKKRITETRHHSDPVDSIKNHDIRILDAMFFNREKEQLERNFARKADLIWDACGCKNFFTDKHFDNPSKMNKRSKKSRGENPEDVCTCNENRMFNLYFQRIRNKMKQLKEDSLNKELHSEQVRQLARELQTGMEQWQDQVLLLQWRALQKAKINAKLQLESKRLKTQTENHERALLHALRFRNVQEMERIRQQIVKKEIEEKDSRIERLKIKREREIMDCKAQAQYTADLRDQLRRTLTPETFDRKVNDAMVKSKFITRALLSSPLVESHIRLG